MTENELQDLRERLEMAERIDKLPTVPMINGEVIRPFENYRQEMRILLEEVERLRKGIDKALWYIDTEDLVDPAVWGGIRDYLISVMKA